MAIDLSGIPDVIKEKLLILPKSSISVSLIVRTRTEDRKLFREFKKKNGDSILEMHSSEYLSFEFFSKDNKSTVMASYLHIATLKDGITEAMKFIDSSLIFNENTNRWGVHQEYLHGYKIEGLINGKSLLFIPKIRRDDANNLELGCNLMINDEACSGFLSFDTLCHLEAFIRHFDLYTASKSLINTALWYADHSNENGRVGLMSSYSPPQILSRRKNI